MALKPTISIEQLQRSPWAIQGLQYSTAKSILSSYSGEFDWLAEMIQNAVDSLERRWAKKPASPSPDRWAEGKPVDVLPDDLVPRLRIVIYRNEDRVLVLDNGTGMSLENFSQLVVPFATDKPPAQERGQKGVGLKYLIYAHNNFAIACKSEELGSGDTGAATDLVTEAESLGMTPWEYGFKSASPTRTAIDAVSLPVSAEVAEFPHLEFSDALLGALVNVQTGVAVEVGVGPETEHGQLSRRIHSGNIRRWEHILRTKTAVGNADISQDMRRISNQGTQRSATMAWFENLHAELFLVDVKPSGGITVNQFPLRPEFAYPHTLVPASVYGRARELIGSNSTATFEMLYEYWDTEAFATEFLEFVESSATPSTAGRDAGEDDANEDQHQQEIQQVKEQLTKLKPEVYAAYGWHNRYWDERTYRHVTGVDESSIATRQPDDQRGGKRLGFTSSLQGGVVLASAGMPMANRIQHSIEIQPQDNDRLFVLISVAGELQLDLGRKVPHATEHDAFLRYVDEFVLRHFTKDNRKILQRNLLHQRGSKQEKDVADQMNLVWGKIRDLEKLSISVPEALKIVFPRRTYLWPELEVEAVFTAWVTRGLLPGLRMRGIVGYVGPLDLLLEAVPCSEIPAGFPADLLPADPGLPCKNPVWGETKVLLSELVRELLDDRKPGKNLSHIDLVVVRDLDVLRLRSRLSQVTANPDDILSDSDLQADTDAEVEITLDKDIPSAGSSGNSVRIVELPANERCFSGSKYCISDQAGNSAEVIVLEELIPVISSVLTSSTGDAQAE